MSYMPKPESLLMGLGLCFSTQLIEPGLKIKLEMWDGLSLDLSWPSLDTYGIHKIPRGWDLDPKGIPNSSNHCSSQGPDPRARIVPPYRCLFASHQHASFLASRPPCQHLFAGCHLIGVLSSSPLCLLAPPSQAIMPHLHAFMTTREIIGD